MGFQSGNEIAYFFICKYINIQKHFCFLEGKQRQLETYIL